MLPSVSLDKIRSKYLDEFTDRGIRLDDDQLTKLDSYISREYGTRAKPDFTQPKKPPNVTSQTSATDMFGNIHSERTEPVKDTSSLLDVAGATLWYGLESYLWETPGYALKKLGIAEPYKWDELGSKQKAGAVLGGGGALFLPGPGGFRGITKLGQMGVSKLSKSGVVRAAESPIQNVIKSSRYTKDRKKGLEQAFRGEVKKAQGDVLSLQAGKEAREIAQDNLVRNMQSAAYRALKESGVKGAESQLQNTALNLSSRVVKQLAEKKGLVNTIDDMVVGWMGGASSPGLVNGLKKYLGMAAQDAFILGVHGGVSSYVSALKHEADWQGLKAFQGAMVLSLGFPALRRIPGGGKVTIGKGLNFAWNKYKAIDYNKIANNSGHGAVKHILRMMLNRTDVRGSTFNIAGTKMSGAAMSKKIDTWGTDKVIESLNAIRKQTSGAKLADWAKSYPGDLLHPGSLTRMLFGIGMMNFESIKDGHFDYMEPEELYSHMVMSAIMSRGRGQWAKEDLQTSMIDYNKYKGMMKLVGMRGTELDNMFAVHQITQDANVVLSGEAARPIMQVFSDFKGKQKSSVTRQFDVGDHKLVADMASLYNTHIRTQEGIENANVRSINVKKFSAEDLANMKKQLNSIELDGRSIEQLGFVGVKSRLNALFADQVRDTYASMYQELEAAGAPVAVKYSEKDGSLIDITFGITQANSAGKDYPQFSNLDRLNQVSERLSEMGMATRTEGLDLSLGTKESRAELNMKEINKIINSYEKNLATKIYGKKLPQDGYIENNIYLNALHDGQASKAIDSIFNIMTGQFQSPSEANFVKSFKNLLYKGDSPVNDWEGQVKYKPSKKVSAIKDKDKREQALETEEQTFAEMKQKLGEVNQLMKGSSPRAHNKEIKATTGELEALYKTYESVYEKFPNDVKMRGVESVGIDYFLHRFSDFRDIPTDIHNLVKVASTPDVGGGKYLHTNLETGKVVGFSEEAIKQSLQQQGISPNSAKGKKVLGEHRALMGSLKQIPDITFANELIVNNQVVDAPSARLITSLYKSRKNDAARSLAEQASKAVDVLKKDHVFSRDVEKINKILDEQINSRTEIPDRVKALQEILEVLDEVSGASYGQSKHIKDAVNSVRRETKKYITQHKGSRGHKVINDIDTDNVYITTLRESMARGVFQEAGYKSQLTELLEALYSGVKTGAVTKEMAYLRHDDLLGEFVKQINQGKEVVSLAKAVEIFQEQYSFENLKDVVGKQIQYLNLNIALDKGDYYKANANAFQELLDMRVRRSDIRTPVQIAKDWSMTTKDEPNKVDAKIIEQVANSKNPGLELTNIVREKIGKGDIEAGKTWREFAEADAVTMLSYMMNATPVKRARIENGRLIYDTNETAINSPTIKFINGFDAFLLDESGTMPVGDGTKSRRFMIGMESQKQGFGKGLNKMLRVPEYLTDEVYKAARYSENVEKDINNVLKPAKDEVPNDNLVLLRVGNRAVLFNDTAPNRDVLNTKFNDWYDGNMKSAGLTSSQKKDFKHKFEWLKDAPMDEANIRTKMTVSYIGEVLNKQFLLDYLKPEMMRNISERQNYESKLYQRALIAGTGNGQVIRKEVLSHMVRLPSIWGNIKNDVKHYRDRGVVHGVIKDEVKDVDGNFVDTPFSVSHIAQRYHTQRSTDRTLTPSQRENARLYAQELRDNPKQYASLEASSIDGAKYISERFARVLFALKGRDMGEFNGIKPYTFANSDNNTMIAKGYYVYDPVVSRAMGNVDVLLGESSAKIYGGNSVSGQQIQARELLVRNNDWVGELSRNNMTNLETMRIPIESIALGVANVDKNVASRSHTITDYQTSENIKKYRIWQELDSIVKQISKVDESRMQGNDALVEIMEATKKQEGYEYDSGAASTALQIMNAGAHSSNPILQRAVQKLIQGPMLDIIRNANNQNSVDTMIAPDVESVLRMPTFAKIVNGRGEVTNRVNLELGETILPHKMGGMKIRNYDKMTFAYSSNGTDILVSPTTTKQGVKGVHKRPYKLGANDRLQIAGQNKEERYTLRDLNNNHIQLVDNILNQIGGTWTQQMKVHDVVDMIERLKTSPVQNGRVIVMDRASMRQIVISRQQQKDLKKLDLAVSVSGNPIPRVGYDMAPLRVKGIGSQADGKLSKINHYDLRTSYQRDHDGDRFYLHHDLGVGLMHSSRKGYGKVKDYIQLDKQPNDINIFGFNQDGIAGKEVSEIGFDKYHSHIQQQKMEVGKALSMKSVLTTLSNAKFSLGDNQLIDIGNVRYAEGTSFAKQWLAVERMMRMNQSGVDVHGGTNKIAKDRGRDAILDALLFGQLPEGVKVPAEFGISPENSIFKGRSKEFTNAEKTIVKEVIKIVKKSSELFNDTYDESGSRTPLDYELRDAYTGLRMLYGDKGGLNRELFQRSFKTALREKDFDQASKIIDMFYGKFPEMKDYLKMSGKNQSNMIAAINSIFKKGKTIFQIKPNDVISFNSFTKDKAMDKVSKRLELSNQGYLLKNLMQKNIFGVNERLWGGVKDSYRQKLGMAADDIVGSMDIIKHISPDGVGMPYDYSVFDRSFPGGKYIYEVFDAHVKAHVPSSQKRGMLKVALEAETNGVRRQLRYEQSDKYRRNEDKINALERKLDSINSAIKYIDEVGIREMVMEPDNYRVVPMTPKADKYGNTNRSQKMTVGHNTHVYRIRGNSPVKLYTKNDGWKNIDYHKMEFVGSIPKGETYRKDTGFSYFEFRDAISPTNMDSNTLMHSYGLLSATTRFKPRTFFKTQQELDIFVGDVKELRRNISMESFESGQVFRKNKAVSPVFSSLGRSKNQMEITDLVLRHATEDGTLSSISKDRYDMLLRYVSQPRSVEGFFPLKTGDGRRLDIPTYKINDRILNEMFDWSFNSGNQTAKRVAEEFIKDWTAQVDNVPYEIKYNKDIAKRTYDKSYYDSMVDPRMANLARHLAGYADPLITEMWKNKGLRTLGKEKSAQYVENMEIYIRELFRGTQRGEWCK